MSDILKAFAVKAFGMTDEDAAAALFEEADGKVQVKGDALDVLLQRDAARVKKMKEEAKALATDKFNDGYKKAQSEILTDYEARLKDAFGVNGDTRGDELIAELKEKLTVRHSLKEDDVKKHPVYLELEKRKAQELKAALDSWEAEKNDMMGQYKRRETYGIVKDRIVNAFNSLELKPNPYAPAHFEAFLRDFEGYDYEINGNDVLVVKDGKRIEDDHGNPTNFNKFVADKLGSWFTFPKQDNKGQAGNQTSGSVVNKTVAAAGSMEEYYRQMAAAKDDTERKAIIDAFRSQK